MKTPFLDVATATKLREQYPTPFYVYDEKGIKDTIRSLKEAFSWNPGFREYFAVKACPNPSILSIFREEGCGVDCASLAELVMARACGFSNDQVFFSSNDTLAGEFTYAYDLGAIINLDDETMLPYFREEVGEFPKTMCCRYNPGGTYSISNGIMDHPGEAKYGMTKEQLFDVMTKLAGEGVERLGIHAFLCSNTLGNEYYPSLAADLFLLAVELYQKTGVRISLINLSGGIGIPYREEEKLPDIRVIGEGVRKAYEEILVPAGLSDVSLCTELGRFMTGPHGALVTTVIHEKHIAKEYIGVDACAANLMRPAIYGAYHHITVLGKELLPRTKKVDVVGSLCENSDKFAIDRMLPEISIGDILFIHDAGAHGYAMGYNYNGKLRCAELLLTEGGEVRLIRRAERIEDYFATLDVIPEYASLRKDIP